MARLASIKGHAPVRSSGWSEVGGDGIPYLLTSCAMGRKPFLKQRLPNREMTRIGFVWERS